MISLLIAKTVARKPWFRTKPYKQTWNVKFKRIVIITISFRKMNYYTLKERKQYESEKVIWLLQKCCNRYHINQQNRFMRVSIFLQLFKTKLFAYFSNHWLKFLINDLYRKHTIILKLQFIFQSTLNQRTQLCLLILRN